MAYNNNVPTNQICKVQTNKKLIAFYDKLTVAPLNYYAQIHAHGEKDESGRKLFSLIGIMIQDYSNGTGNSNVITQFNLTPEEMQFILSRIEAGFADFEMTKEKIFGEPDQNGFCTAQRFMISRHPYRNDGSLSNNPWSISISNGKGVKVKNSNGGSYMKGGSYSAEKNGYINLADADMYTLYKRVDTYIKQWETIMSPHLITSGRQNYQQYLENARAAQYNQIGNNGPQYSYAQNDQSGTYGNAYYSAYPNYS